MRLITIGDPHYNVSNSDGTTSKDRLIKIKNFINLTNTDIAIFLGDITDNHTTTEFSETKTIINQVKSSITKFVIIGNHDLTTTGSTGKDRFESYFGSSKHRVEITETINGVTTTYQLLFIGMYKDGSGNFYWDFDFSSLTATQKTLNTLIFIHGPCIPAPANCTCCNWGNPTDGYYFGYPMAYPYDIKTELNKFTHLRAIYTGHVHYQSYQTVDILDNLGNGSKNVRHITQGALIDRIIGQCDTGRKPTDYVGFTNITPSSFQYKNLNYNVPFIDPFTTELVAIYYAWYDSNFKECLNPDPGNVTACHNLGKDSEVYNCPATNDHNSMFPNRWAGRYKINVTATPVLYSSIDENVIRWQLGLMKYTGVKILAFSYWGAQKPITVTALSKLFAVLNSPTNPHPNIKISIYYEDANNRSVPLIKSDIDSIISNYGSSKYFHKVNNKPVFWVYGVGTVAFAQKWDGIRKDKNLYIIQKEFMGSTWKSSYSYLNLADAYHQYAPANRYVLTETTDNKYADGGSAGFWRYHACARLCRPDVDPVNCPYTEFDDAVKSMKNSGARYHIIFWNEWQENSGIEPATLFNHIEGPTGSFTKVGDTYGNKYLDIVKKYFNPSSTVCNNPDFDFRLV